MLQKEKKKKKERKGRETIIGNSIARISVINNSMHIHVQAVKIRSDHGYPLGIPPLSVNQLIPRTVQERLVAASKRLGSLYGRGRVVSRTRQGWHAPPLANSKWGVWLDLIPSTPLSHSLSLLSITANAPLHRPLSPSRLTTSFRAAVGDCLRSQASPSISYW